jgi:imidazolonepropionase
MAILISPCTQLLTLAGDPLPRKGPGQSQLGLVEQGAVLIEGETIGAVGPAQELEKRYGDPSIQRINAEGCVVMPGFVDSHAHPVFAHPRDGEYEERIQGATYQEIATRGGGILRSVRDLRGTSKDELLKSSEARIRRAMEYGTTTLEAKSGYGLDLENEMKMLEVVRELQQSVPVELVPTFLGAHEIPPEFRSDRAAYLDLLTEEMIPKVAQARLAEFCDCFVEPHVFTVAEAGRIGRAALQYGLGIKLHADQLSRSGATRLGIELGAVSVDHLEQIDAADIQALAASNTVATLLPGSVFHLGLQRYPPARALIDARVPVALATDFNPGSSPTLSMQMILSLACTQMRMTPAEAIVASTINGAHALRRGNRLGSLEPGKRADVCIAGVPDYRQIPYFFGMNHCSLTLKKGKMVYQRL